MRMLKAAVAANVMVFMTDSSDHVTGKTGLALTITASKDGAAFAAIDPDVTERGSGWYSVALADTDTDTEGDLALHLTGSGADASDLICRVFVDTIAQAVRGEVDANSTRLADIQGSTDLIAELRKLLRNKRVLDPATGVETIYDDGGAPLFTRNVFEDAAGTQPYRDQGADRVERYT